MKKLLLILILGINQAVAQTTLPTLNLISVDEGGPTFTVTTGTEAALMAFSILIQDVDHNLIDVVKFKASGDCSEFSLPPNTTSPEFFIPVNPALNDDECQEPRTLNILECGDEGYTYLLHIKHSKQRAAPVTVVIPCQ